MSFNPSPRFFREARGIHLDSDSKDAIRDTLFDFIRKNPAEPLPSPSIAERMTRPAMQIFCMKMSVTIVTFLLFVTIIGR